MQSCNHTRMSWSIMPIWSILSIICQSIGNSQLIQLIEVKSKLYQKVNISPNMGESTKLDNIILKVVGVRIYRHAKCRGNYKMYENHNIDPIDWSTPINHQTKFEIIPLTRFQNDGSPPRLGKATKRKPNVFQFQLFQSLSILSVGFLSMVRPGSVTVGPKCPALYGTKLCTCMWLQYDWKFSFVWMLITWIIVFYFEFHLPQGR